MPVWHEQTKQWVADGRLHVVGLIQEQHPDRCRLLAQWHQFDWPILHDPINVVGATAVPIFIAIDEHGIVRSTRARLDDFESSFLNQSFSEDASGEPSALTPPIDPDSIPADQLRRKADSLFLWQRESRLDEAISLYRRALQKDPDDGRSRFRLGVCLLHRFENQSRIASDFQAAIESWESALDRRPNQYIWRRRIQQYGPRLAKPYPFYDWVTQAEQEIRKRGDEPIALRVRPSGAEIAAPMKQDSHASHEADSPDPEGRIRRDEQPLIQTSVATVPSRPTAGSTIRLHVTFSPNESRQAHWNNEAEPLRLWIDAPAGVLLEEALVHGTNPPQAESNEVRRLDIEFLIPEDATDTIRLDAYALYYVCEEIDGVCQYLRQDIPIEFEVAP